MFRFVNPNPCNKRIGDCSVRAVSLALGISWDVTYWMMCKEGFDMCDMPSSNAVWGNLLRRHGFRKETIDCECSTVRDFCREHPSGVYVIAMENHVAAVIDGDLYDAWDSSDETPLYAWRKNERVGYAV